MQLSLFKMLCLGSIGMDHVISEGCYERTFLQRNNWKMTVNISYNFFVKFHEKHYGSHNISMSMLTKLPTSKGDYCIKQ